MAALSTSVATSPRTPSKASSPSSSAACVACQHCGEQHLHRYLAEFDFRHTHRIGNGVDDKQRAALSLKGIVGKHLT